LKSRFGSDSFEKFADGMRAAIIEATAGPTVNQDFGAKNALQPKPR